MRFDERGLASGSIRQSLLDAVREDFKRPVAASAPGVVPKLAANERPDANETITDLAGELRAEVPKQSRIKAY